MMGFMRVRVAGKMGIAVALALFGSLTVAACGDEDNPNARPCDPASSEPLRGAVVQATLRSAGYEMLRRERCDAVTADYLENRSEDADAEGHVICLIQKQPIRVQGRLFPKATVIRESGEEPNYYLQNVKCAVYARGDHPERQFADFRAAFEQLATPR
jgi:hypothetical protein